MGGVVSRVWHWIPCEADYAHHCRDVGTVPQRKALVMAEAATKRLTEIFTNEFGFLEEVPELVSTAALRVRGEWKRRNSSDREVKWAVGKIRH